MSLRGFNVPPLSPHPASSLALPATMLAGSVRGVACSHFTPFASTSAPRATPIASRWRAQHPARAAPDDKDSNPFLSNDQAAPSSSSPANDARIERVEQAIRGGKRSSTATKPRSIPIRGMVSPPKEKPESTEFAPWKEGQLFPEGWEQMSGAEKMKELYMGQRGFLFWINKLAYGAGIAMLVGWVIFRFVGPNLGLYQLAGDAVTPGV